MSSWFRLLSLLGVLSGCSELRAPTSPVLPVTPEADRALATGVFLGDAHSTPQAIASAIASFTSRSGRHPAIVKTFVNLDADLSSTGWNGQILKTIHSAGSVNLVALDLTASTFSGNDLLSRLASGEADALLRRLARDVASLPFPILIEPAWEMNGNWGYAWQGDVNGGAHAPVHFQRAWQRIVHVFRESGAIRARWVFSPNVGNPYASASDTTHWNWYGKYYPGDAYVDYLGIHAFLAPQLWGGPWRSPSELFDGKVMGRLLSDMELRFPSKGILISEFAAAEGAECQKGQWMEDAYRLLLSHPRILGAVWFDMNKEADWRIDSSPCSLHSFRRAISSPRVNPTFAVP